MDVKNNFGKRLSALLKRKGMNQAKIVRSCDISKNTVSTWCNAERMPNQLDTLDEFAIALKMSSEEILRETAPPEEADSQEANLLALRYDFDTLMDAARYAAHKGRIVPEFASEPASKTSSRTGSETEPKVRTL